MSNKILLGSIVSVVILVLVSFTGVVGYQTTKSSTIAKASPLFNVRTSKAIGKERKDIACDYVGKGEECILSIPKRDIETSRIQKVLEIISKMDDNKFKVYLNKIINQLQKNDKYDGVNINEVMNAIHQLRDNPEKTNLYVYKNGNYTWRVDWQPTLCWFPGCFIIRGIINMLLPIAVEITLRIAISTLFILGALTIYCPNTTPVQC